MATWKDAPAVDYFLLVSETVEQNGTTTVIIYKAKNGEICEGELRKTILTGHKSVKSHEFECFKEYASTHNVQDNDKSFIGDDDSDESDGHQGPHTRSRRNKWFENKTRTKGGKRRWKKYTELMGGYDYGNVREIHKRSPKPREKDQDGEE